MAPITQTNNMSEDKNSSALLYDELLQGFESMKNGEGYTIEKAWEEINKI